MELSDIVLYEFSWCDHNAYIPFFFVPKRNQGEDQFRMDCERALFECGEEYIESENGWIGMDKWVEYACCYVEKYGYRCMNPRARVEIIGGCIIQKEDSDMDYARLLDGLFDKACAKNSALEKELYKDMI